MPQIKYSQIDQMYGDPWGEQPLWIRRLGQFLEKLGAKTAQQKDKWRIGITNEEPDEIYFWSGKKTWIYKKSEDVFEAIEGEEEGGHKVIARVRGASLDIKREQKMNLKEFFLHESFPREMEPYVGKIRRNLMLMYDNDQAAAESAARALLLQVGPGGANNLFITLANMPGAKRAEFVTKALETGKPPEQAPKAKKEPKPKPEPKKEPEKKPEPPKKSAWEDDEDDDEGLGPELDYEDPTADKPSRSDSDEDDDWEEEIKAKSKTSAPNKPLPPPKAPKKKAQDLEGSDEVEFHVPASHVRATAVDKDDGLGRDDFKQISAAADKYADEFRKKNMTSFKDMSPEKKAEMERLYGGGPKPKMTDTFGLKPTGKKKDVGPSF